MGSELDLQAINIDLTPLRDPITFAILLAIENGTFDYSVTFPDSKNAHKFSPTQYTIRTYLAEWLANKEPTIKASTLRDYRKIIHNLVIPRFGEITPHMLTRADVRNWVASMDCSTEPLPTKVGRFGVAG